MAARRAPGPATRIPYERGGTAKLLTLFRPASGLLRAKGVLSVTNAVLHPWLEEQLSMILTRIEKEHPAAELPPEAQRPPCAQWETWLGHPPRGKPLPPLRIVLVLDNLAGHLSCESFALVLRAWGDAALHARWRLVVEHGRVGATHHCATRFGWAAS